MRWAVACVLDPPQRSVSMVCKSQRTVLEAYLGRSSTVLEFVLNAGGGDFVLLATVFVRVAAPRRGWRAGRVGGGGALAALRCHRL